MADKKIGKVSHYYGKINVAIIDLTGPLAQGETIKIVGKGGEFTQTADSMEVEHQRVSKATKGQSIGLLVENKVKEGDLVYKVG